MNLAHNALLVARLEYVGSDERYMHPAPDHAYRQACAVSMACHSITLITIALHLGVASHKQQPPLVCTCTIQGIMMQIQMHE